MALADIIAGLPARLFRAADGQQSETFTIPGAPYTHALGTGAPFNDPPGFPVVPPSNMPNAVVITGGSHSSWTQVTQNPQAGQFTLDTSASPTGGTIGFNSTDSGQAVTAQWIGSSLVNEGLLGGFLAGLRFISAAAPNGLATLGSDGYLQQRPPHGMRQRAMMHLATDVGFNDVQGDATNYSAYDAVGGLTADLLDARHDAANGGITSVAGSVMEVDVHLVGIASQATSDWILLAAHLHAFYNNRDFYLPLGRKNVAAGDYLSFDGSCVFTGYPQDNYTCELVYMTGGPGVAQYFFIRPGSDPTEQFLRLSLTEYL